MGEDRLDIPDTMRDTAQYRASLGHKVTTQQALSSSNWLQAALALALMSTVQVQHSFDPNCELWEAEHPVFGLVPCVRTLGEL